MILQSIKQLLDCDLHFFINKEISIQFKFHKFTFKKLY